MDMQNEGRGSSESDVDEPGLVDPRTSENWNEEGRESMKTKRKRKEGMKRANLIHVEVDVPAEFMDPRIWENLNDEGRESERAGPTGGEVDEPGFMDPKIWGDLQYHIPLDMIYAMLPLREFFQLRLVCKEWNRFSGDSYWPLVPWRILPPQPLRLTGGFR
jgi:hypothetical protein